MLSPNDIQRLCRRRYPAFLKAAVTGEPFFPLRVRFGRPSTSEEWDKLRTEVAALAESKLGYRIDWIEIRTRRWGRQRLPERVWFEDEDEFLGALGKREEVAAFRANLALSRSLCPELEPWLASNVTRLVEFAAVWPDLLKVCTYFRANPRPQLFVRELPVDMHTKFVEAHMPVLGGMLDFLLPADAKTAGRRFEERFGLRFDEPLIRFRVLAGAPREALGIPASDFSVPLSEFRGLGRWTGVSVMIVENKATFLALPAVVDVAIWGGGNAAELLTSVDWLADCFIRYWGDMDVPGFHILSRLRKRFPKVVSVLMDEATLDAFAALVTNVTNPPFEEIDGLTPQEVRAYSRVRAAGLRLEQERIPHRVAMDAIVREFRAQTTEVEKG
jgi:hypothetical protein